jgi:class 3 adenylate cyclase
MASPRVERRLAAILAADIVGYSRLVEKDESGALAAIKRLREAAIDPLLAEHKGRIVKLMGDGAIVEFGSVVDAVICAAGIQRAVGERQAAAPAASRVVFRIGVNLGDVVVEGDDLLGDGVNVAARLEQLCEPGQVLISGTAYDHLKGKLDLAIEPKGVRRLKNIAEPVRVYGVRIGGPAIPRRSARRRVGDDPWWPWALCSLWWLPPRGGGSGRTSRSWRPSHPLLCCRSPISATTKPPGAWRTASPRTSSPTCPGSASSTSSPRTRRRSTRATPATCARSAGR